MCQAETSFLGSLFHSSTVAGGLIPVSCATQALVSRERGLFKLFVLHASPRVPCVQGKLSLTSCASSTF